MNFHIDLGQMIIAGMIAIIGYFIKKEITTFGERLDRHENVIFSMAQNIATVVGQVGILNKMIGLDLSPSSQIEMHRTDRSKL